MIYLLYNGPAVTTAAPVPVATGTGLKTLLQLKPSATAAIRALAWGISFDGYVPAAPGTVELIETDVAATVTAFVANDITKFDGDALNGGDPTTNLIQVGTNASGYTASAEGTTTASRILDIQQIAPINQYIWNFPLGDEPILQIAKFTRIRVKFAATVNALCWIKVRV